MHIGTNTIIIETVLSIKTTDQPMAQMESASASKSSLGAMVYMGRTEGEGEIFPLQIERTGSLVGALA
jgi:hypothetical protein